MKNVAIGIILGVIGSGLFWVLSGESVATNSSADYVQDRRAIFTFLAERLAVDPMGVTAEHPKKIEKRPLPNADWPPAGHIESVVTNQPWHNESNQLFMVRIEDELVESRAADQARSTWLLEHYFSSLSELGFTADGMDTMIASSHTTFANNTWKRPNDDRIVIVGGVYVNELANTALITVRIVENSGL